MVELYGKGEFKLSAPTKDANKVKEAALFIVEGGGGVQPYQITMNNVMNAKSALIFFGRDMRIQYIMMSIDRPCPDWAV